MNIATDSVVRIHYTLKNDAGEVLDSSKGREPLTYLHGRGNIIPGLESELEGRGPGERLQVAVAPAQGYGEYNDALVQRVPRGAVQGADDIQQGMQVHAKSGDSVHTLRVTEVDAESITLDANHPLAGETLHFDVEVADVRPATQEELAQGQAQELDGHAH